MRILKKTKQLQLLDGAIAVVLAVVGVAGYRLLWAPNFEVSHTVYVYVDEQKDLEALCRQLEDSAGCQSTGSFKRLAGWLKYPSHMHTGRYAVLPGIRISLSNTGGTIRFMARSRISDVLFCCSM